MKTKKHEVPKFKLIGKTIFFPEQKILAIGDLHIGYEKMLNNEGIILPFNQLENTKKEIKETIQKITSENKEIKKIIFLGDIKHNFGFEKTEALEVRKFLEFLEKNFSDKKIIFIKGNHDVIQLQGKDYKDYYIDSSEKIAFTHGDKNYIDLFNKKIKIIVMAHIHPAVMLKDPSGIKREKFKAFLIGKWKNKNLIIVPSFFPLIEGTEINELYSSFEKTKKDFAIINKKELKNFKVYIIGEKEIYEFGKFKDL